MSIKIADSKGRISLGKAIANRSVIILQTGEGVWEIQTARVIPDRESWLYENDEALSRVRSGLKQAVAGRFAADPPDLDADAALADSIDDADAPA
jgi:hypothetical protein